MCFELGSFDCWFVRSLVVFGPWIAPLFVLFCCWCFGGDFVVARCCGCCLLFIVCAACLVA